MEENTDGLEHIRLASATSTGLLILGFRLRRGTSDSSAQLRELSAELAVLLAQTVGCGQFPTDSLG